MCVFWKPTWKPSGEKSWLGSYDWKFNKFSIIKSDLPKYSEFDFKFDLKVIPLFLADSTYSIHR